MPIPLSCSTQNWRPKHEREVDVTMTFKAFLRKLVGRVDVGLEAVCRRCTHSVRPGQVPWYAPPPPPLHTILWDGCPVPKLSRPLDFHGCAPRSVTGRLHGALFALAAAIPEDEPLADRVGTAGPSPAARPARCSRARRRRAPAPYRLPWSPPVPASSPAPPRPRRPASRLR